MCLELALEGERLCKAGETRAGVAFFQVLSSLFTSSNNMLNMVHKYRQNFVILGSDSSGHR
jgi:hypothetical protein